MSIAGSFGTSWAPGPWECASRNGLEELGAVLPSDGLPLCCTLGMDGRRNCWLWQLPLDPQHRAVFIGFAEEIVKTRRQTNSIFQRVRDGCVCHWKPAVLLERLPAGVPSQPASLRCSGGWQHTLLSRQCCTGL